MTVLSPRRIRPRPRELPPGLRHPADRRVRPHATGGPGRPGASDVGLAPDAERANTAQDQTEPDTRKLSKFLGLDKSPVQIYGWIQNSYTATPGFNPRNRSTETVFPNRLANSWQGNQYY